MNARTEAEMATLLCPQAKLFGEPTSTCRTGRCAIFREADPITPAWIRAVQKVAVEIGDKSPGHPKAAKIVSADPEAHGVERLYYCGLGGKP